MQCFSFHLLAILHLLAISCKNFVNIFKNIIAQNLKEIDEKLK